MTASRGDRSLGDRELDIMQALWRLGHATVAFTMQVYAHVLPGMQTDAAAAFGELVFGQRDGDPDQ